MEISNIVAGLGIGLAAGLFSGLVGVGGGVIIIPLLAAIGYSHHAAQGTALLVFSLPVLAASAYTYYRQGRADLKLAIFIALGVVIASFVSGTLAQSLPTRALARIFSGVLVGLGIYLISKPLLFRRATPQVELHALPLKQKAFRGFLIGLFSGALSGITGLGGGVIIVPLIRLLIGHDQHTAQGTSLATLSIPVLLAGMLPYYRAGHIDVSMGLAIAGGLLVSSLLAGLLAQRLPGQKLQIGFGVLIVGLGLRGLLG